MKRNVSRNKYKEPLMEVIELTVETIITTSGSGGGVKDEVVGGTGADEEVEYPF